MSARFYSKAPKGWLALQMSSVVYQRTHASHLWFMDEDSGYRRMVPADIFGKINTFNLV